MISGPSTESLWDWLRHSGHTLAILWPYSGVALYRAVGQTLASQTDVKVCDLIDIQGLFGTCCLISKAVEKLLLYKPSGRILAKFIYSKVLKGVTNLARV